MKAHVPPGPLGRRAVGAAGLALACGLAAAGCASAKAATLDSSVGKLSPAAVAGTNATGTSPAPSSLARPRPASTPGPLIPATTVPTVTVPTGSVADSCPSGVATVTVAGQSTVSGTPDEVSLDLSVQTESRSAATAMSQNATISSALVRKLKSDGIPASQLQTSQYSVQPVYNNSGSVITGYQVVNSVTVTLYDVTKTGHIIDDAGRVAGNAIQVGGINFSLRSETKLLGEARADAVRQAAQQAALMAAAAGSKLGPVCSLTDNSSENVVTNTPVPYGAASKAAATPVEAGTLQVTANVTAVYQLVS